MLKIDLKELRLNYGKQLLLIGFASLLIAGGAYAVGYALVGGEVVETRVVDAPALALSLAGEIMGLEAQVTDATQAGAFKLAEANELKAAGDYLGSKYPLAVGVLNEAREDALTEASIYEGEAVWLQEQADAKQAELNALNAVYSGVEPKGA